ncbi:MAG: lamin tail domain-containing protein [Salibacteraceae bacterium]|nr:lamin tail domain-containing protein [Salibacteraceae bacterium]
MKKFTSLLLTVLVSAVCFGQIVITEISYNGPESGTDTTEFIELYNKTSASINLSGYSFSQGVTYTFPNVSIGANGYLVIAVDSAAIMNVFGASARQWTSGGLSNGGEDIVLENSTGVTIDSVDYDDGGIWPSDPDGNGSTLVFCDTSKDNNDGTNWKASTYTVAGKIVNAKQVYGSPGKADSVCISGPPSPPILNTNTIGSVTTDDANGEPDSNGVKCNIVGIVHGINMGGTSTQYILLDVTGGITVRKSGGFTPSYVVNEGDSITVWGTVGHYNGLTQFNADSMKVLSSNGRIRTARKVATPNSSTESDYIRIDSVTIISGTWPMAGNSANIILETPAKDTVTMRIDRNGLVDDSVTTAPTGMFDLIGYGGQFDGSVPRTSGYQILPQVKGHIIIRATCNDPSGATLIQASTTTARLTWTSGSGVSNIEFGALGYTQGTGTIVSSQSSPYIITNLTTGSSYDVYYQDTCTGVGTSNWVGPVTVTLSASPQISAIWRTTSTNVMVAYTDSMSNASATSTFRYKGITGLTSVALNGSNDTATLTYGAPFVNGDLNILTIDSVTSATLVMLDTAYTHEFIYNNTKPSIVITEIMYNDRSGADTLEYLEIHNSGTSVAFVGGMEFTQGITYTVPANYGIPAGAYLVIAKNALTHTAIFGNTFVDQWTSGGLSNGGEDIAIVNSEGDTIDYVNYSDRGTWPTDPDGNGFSLVLCDVFSDNNLGSSWGVEPAQAGTSGYNASPGMANTCRPPFVPPFYTISAVTTVDASGVADSNGVKCSVKGLVASNQFSTAGASGPDVQFTVIEADNSAGVTAVSFNDAATLGYSPLLGDSVQLYGTLNQFRGLLQFNMDSVKVISSGHAMPAPERVDTIAEIHESRIIRISGVEIVDPSQWPAAGSDANVDIINMKGDTIIMRIDQHTNTVASWISAPIGKFEVIGVGGQYSFNNIDGYQLLPRFDSDIDTSKKVLPCPIPKELSTSVIAEQSATVTWDSPGTTWNIGWAKGHMSTMPTDSVMAITTKPYTITGLDTNTHYHVWVQEVCPSGVSEWAGPLMFKTLTATVGILELATAKALIAFPNPNNIGSLRLNRITDVVIRNLLGQPVIVKTNADEIDINELSSGIYLLESAEGDTIKLIVE